jgi:hypothetical protein
MMTETRMTVDGLRVFFGGRARRAFLVLSGVGFVLAGAGCSDLATAPEDQVPSLIQLSQDEVRLGSLGERQGVSAQVLDQNGREIRGAALLWIVEDPSVVTLEANNEVLARRNGETVIQVILDPARARVTPGGYRSGRPMAELRVQVRQAVGAFNFTPGAVSLYAVGQQRQMTVTLKDPLGTPFQRAISVRWESSDPTVVDVTPEGRLRALDDGAAQVRAITDEGTGAATVQVATRFTFAACVSSSASRLAAGRTSAGGTGAGGTGAGGSGAGSASTRTSGAQADGCASTPLRAVAPESDDGGAGGGV